MSEKRNIALFSRGNGIIRNEYKSAGEILPGQIVKVDSNNDVIKNDVTGTVIPKRIALESMYDGNGVYYPYTTNDLVQVNTAGSGDRYNLRVVTGLTVTIGTLLKTTNDGNLEIAGAGETAFAVAMENVSTSGTNPTLVKVEII